MGGLCAYAESRVPVKKEKLENVAIANALQLEAVWRRAVPIRFNSSPMPSLKSLSISVTVLERFFPADMLRHAVILNFNPVTLTFHLWPWTNVVDQLRHRQTLYEIWAKSDNPRRSYCSLNIWTYGLDHVSRVGLCFGIVCTSFKLSLAIHLRDVTIFWC